jgi:hypothetical protein
VSEDDAHRGNNDDRSVGGFAVKPRAPSARRYVDQATEVAAEAMKHRSPRCLRELCFVFRTSRNDHDVALATDPLCSLPRRNSILPFIG